MNVICRSLGFMRWALRGPRRRVWYVAGTDRRWSFYWDAYYITKGLRQHCGLQARVTANPWKLRRQIIHFGDRYAFLNGPAQTLHESNHVFLTWFHGGPDSPDPEMRRLFSDLVGAADGLNKVVVSCRISGEILTRGGIAASKVERIPLGVDLARFAPPTPRDRAAARAELGIPADAVCVGSFQKDGVGWDDGNEPKLVKGPDVFVDAAAKLFARHQNLIVLLTGPARGYVKQGLDAAGVPYVHRFLSEYPRIVRCYHALDLYIISSRMEGGPKALLESWATGVPLVSTRVGMSADLIEHGRNGMLAEVEDADALAEHASGVIEDASLREVCRREALEAVRLYDWALIAEQYYEKLYRPVLEGTAPPR